MEADALVDTLADKLTGSEARTLGHTQRDVEAQALVHPKADTPAFAEGETLANTLVDVEAQAPVSYAGCHISIGRDRGI